MSRDKSWFLNKLSNCNINSFSGIINIITILYLFIEHYCDWLSVLLALPPPLREYETTNLDSSTSYWLLTDLSLHISAFASGLSLLCCHGDSSVVVDCWQLIQLFYYTEKSDTFRKVSRFYCTHVTDLDRGLLFSLIRPQCSSY